MGPHDRDRRLESDDPSVAAPWRVLADGSRLPFADAVAEVIAVTDAPFFPAEFARVLNPEGAVLCTNALGADAPYHLPSQALVEAMEVVTDTSWDAVESEAGWGWWAVLRRR